MSRRLHFICNGIFSPTIAGGDIHFLKLAAAAAAAGYELNFFGGQALREVLAAHHMPGTITLTDERQMPKVNTGALRGQFALFADYARRYARTRQLLSQIAPEDRVYAVSDYWFDVLPVVAAAARRKFMVLHMEAPSLGQVIRASRPDVDVTRLASLHYWGSQEMSLRAFARCPARHIFYLHSNMAPRLRRLGIPPEEMTWLSYGLETELAATIPPSPAPTTSSGWDACTGRKAWTTSSPRSPGCGNGCRIFAPCCSATSAKGFGRCCRRGGWKIASNSPAL